MPHADEVSAVSAGMFRPGAGRGVSGFFRVNQDGSGRWWLMDPAGRPFFLRGVQAVRKAPAHVDAGLPFDPAARLREWGFNALGVGSDPALREDGFPFLATVGFGQAGPQILAGEARLPDVFDPEWPRLAQARANEICTTLRECRELIGWVTDDCLNWAHPSLAGRPSLLQICLSLEPSFPAYHAAWEFVLAHHGGRLEQVAHAWHAAIPNKEVIRELTRADEGLGTRGYLRDEVRWAREFARRYFTSTAAAVRAADPNHLVLGCRFEGLAGMSVLAECVYPAVDVSLPNWNELPVMAPNPLQPVLASDVCWAKENPLRPSAKNRIRRLTTIERTLRRGRVALDRVARHPAVVGYTWSRWEDDPGEQPPFGRGLVHANGAEALEHTELLTQFNLRAETLRRAPLG